MSSSPTEHRPPGGESGGTTDRSTRENPARDTGRADRQYAGPDGGRSDRRSNWYDVCAAGAAALLFTAAVVVGRAIEHDQGTVRLRWPPLYGYWLPHIGPGTAAAPVVAALTVIYGPVLARNLRWSRLLPAVWGGAMAWSWSLALIDGWHRGIAERLTTKYEYLQSVGEVHDIGTMLKDFTSRILMDSPDNWPAHVAGHPPGALLTFVGLDRIGLSGGGWAAAWVITVAASAAAAVLVTVRALSTEETARRAAPFVVLAPAAVWMAVSADGYFTAVTAWALALLALSATRRVRAPRTVAAASGLLFGLACFLSYGLVLIGVVALAVLIAARTARPVPWVLSGMLPWFVAFTAAGFWWFDGYSTLVERYYQGAAGVRPFSYFVWSNLAVQALVAGPAVIAGLRRTFTARNGRTAVLVAGGLCAVLAADLSGMSKAETERIWLPFALWLLPATALLPRASVRWWLSAQAVLALTVNHLLITGW